MLEDIDLYEQCEDGQMQIQVDESSAIIAERDMKMYINFKDHKKSAFDQAHKLTKDIPSTQPLVKSAIKKKTGERSYEKNNDSIVCSKKLQRLKSRKPKTTRRVKKGRF